MKTTRNEIKININIQKGIFFYFISYTGNFVNGIVPKGVALSAQKITAKMDYSPSPPQLLSLPYVRGRLQIHQDT